MIGAFRELFEIIKTNIRERKITKALAKIELKKEYNNSILGVAWAFIRPMVYVLVFYFAIRVGLRGDKHFNGVPQLLWLVPGSFMWFFISNTIMHCGKSLITNRHLITKMVFPVSTIPVIAVCAEFFVHAILIFAVIILYGIWGFGLSIYYLQIVYYLICAFVFCCIIATLISALSAISRDVSYLMPSVNQALFWLSPILWPLKNVKSHFIKRVVELNPVAYLTEGIRNAFVYHKWFFEQWHYALYFWGLMLLLALLTSFIWSRTKTEFADVL